MKNLYKAIFILLILVTISCKAKKVQPTSVIVKIDTIFRTREKIIHDTVTNTKIVEKIVEKEVIKYVDKVIEKLIVKTDTIVKNTRDTITYYETIYLEDNNKIILLSSQLDSIKKVNTQLANSNNKFTNPRNWLIYWLLPIFILGSGLIYYLHKNVKQIY